MISFNNSSGTYRMKQKFIKKEEPYGEYEKYKRKYRNIKRTIKDFVFVSTVIYGSLLSY